MITAADLVSQFGSPLYVYDLDRLDAALASLRSVIPERSIVYYSLKANPHPELARTLRGGGARAEISSAGELTAAATAGFTGPECLYTGPGKTRSELRLAIDHGVRRFSVESYVDYERVAEVAANAGVVAECLIRVNAAEAVGGSSLRMTGAATQFGIDEAQLRAMPDRFSARPGARVIGLHLFPVSNARGEPDLVAAMRASAATAARIRAQTPIPVSVVDLGGGFAAPYGIPGDLPTYPRLRAALESALDECFPGWRTGEVEVAFESGRYLTGPCGRLVTTVLDVKSSQGHSFAVLDSGINHLGGLAGLGRTLPPAIVPAGATSQPHGALVGPLCTPADVLARNVGTDALAPGDLIEVPNLGAYGLTASLLGFLSRPAPIELTLRGGAVVTADQAWLTRASVPVPDHANRG